MYTRKKLCFILIFSMICVSMFSPINILASITNKQISLMGIVHDDGADRTSWISTASMYVEGVGNTDTTEFIGFSATDAMNQFYNQDMVVLQTHGKSTGILTLKDGNEVFLSMQAVDTAFSQDALIKLRICFIGACSCGAGGSTADNFINTLYEQGALCVIGYQGTVSTACNSRMLNRFCYYIGTGYSVNNALARAEQDVLSEFGQYGGVDNRLIRGIAEIAMTDISYRTIGSSIYSLEDYEMQTLTIDDNDVTFYDGESLCTKSGDSFLIDENNKVCSYIKLDTGEESDYSKSFQGDAFFESFELDGYKLEVNQYETSKMVCMRGYINDLKTNDIIYYTVGETDELLSYAYPRVGTARTVADRYESIDMKAIVDYVEKNYNVGEIEEVIINVDDVNNPIANVDYRAIGDGYESIETITIPLCDINEEV